MLTSNFPKLVKRPLSIDKSSDIGKEEIASSDDICGFMPLSFGTEAIVE